jgi:hypothetical protein
VGSEQVGGGKGSSPSRLVSSLFRCRGHCGLHSIMSLLRRYLSSLGCLLLGFLVCTRGVTVASAGEEKLSVRECGVVTQ